MKIIGKFIYLKKINVTDASFIFKLRNKKDISEFLHKPPRSVTAQKKWIMINIKNNKTLDFIIYRKKNHKKIGTIAFDKIKKLNAEWGRWICQGNIFENIESVIVLLNFGFKKLKFKNIYSLTNKENTKVVNFHKKSSALCKGIKKSIFKIRNKRKDGIMYNFNYKRFVDFKKKFESMTVSAQ